MTTGVETLTECDNKGQRVNVNIRALLVRESHLQSRTVPPCEPPADPLLEVAGKLPQQAGEVIGKLAGA